jgi:hypothetical protein
MVGACCLPAVINPELEGLCDAGIYSFYLGEIPGKLCGQAPEKGRVLVSIVHYKVPSHGHEHQI